MTDSIDFNQKVQETFDILHQEFYVKSAASDSEVTASATSAALDQLSRYVDELFEQCGIDINSNDFKAGMSFVTDSVASCLLLFPEVRVLGDGFIATVMRCVAMMIQLQKEREAAASAEIISIEEYKQSKEGVEDSAERSEESDEAA